LHGVQGVECSNHSVPTNSKKGQSVMIGLLLFRIFLCLDGCRYRRLSDYLVDDWRNALTGDFESL
jgi:hypothetical protein